ncbi:hypothetical protein HN51_048537 [Arachis hypogaea]|uniref:Uncharacterized protein n=1 Tax=Arachis hypogaea TaxID=3818 RepID=A0A445ALF5_ARAHY|nr:uncharacterized protein LOC107628520 [Arachis ipaensis]XP_025634025.1 uncharacterized protein LOC112728195 [Arachis hypogaea]RYR27277.1 hypothetical protein Ahy_B02g061614 [Arachis hypogaea]
MSSIITYLLLLIFLFISLHACNARHLSTLDKKKMEKKPHFSFKISSGDDEKKVLGSNPKQVNEEGGNDNKKVKTNRLVSSDHRRRSTKNQRVLKTKGKGAIKTTNSLVSSSSISWRVPHKKPSEKNPGFNLDYSPPKTHPPSHN